MFSKTVIVYLILYLCCVLCTRTLTPVLKVTEGRLRGLHSVLSGQNKYYGIPYAVAERFQPPRPPSKWEGIFNAINPISTCPQAISFLTIGREDCLHLDVHTPDNIVNTTKLPVMVFIHGGAYYHGAKYHYDPEYLVNQKIVGVVINYRLGILGYLCHNGVANLGMKDQIAALEWIKKNIAVFGGDPENVTIFGQSAGASSVGMHMLVEASRGLFHKAILQSGSPITPWAFNLDNEEPTIRDAKKVGADINNLEAINPLDTFTNASLFNLLVATKGVSTNTRYFKYSPCIEDKSIHNAAVFSDSPYNLLKTGNYNQVPVIVGTTNLEGLLFYGLNNKRSLRDLNDNFLEKLPSVFQWCSDEEKEDISLKIRSYYFGNNTINESQMENIMNYYADWVTYSTNSRFANIIASTSTASVYSYIFSYEGDRNVPKYIYGPNIKMNGATHSDDVFYLFKLLGLPAILSNRDKLMIDRMTTMWTNFAKTGNPTPERTRLLPIQWLPFTSNNTKVLNINTNMKMVNIPSHMRGEFFLELLCEYGKPGFVPCESKQNCSKV